MTNPVIKFANKLYQLLEAAIKSFNFAFFLVSLILWISITTWEVISKPFELSLLWSAFNILYGQFSFKIGCIILIVFNGLQTIRLWIFSYYELKEYGEHFWKLKKIIKGEKKE